MKLRPIETKGKRRGQMNKLESEYSLHLRARGLEHRYEWLKLSLGGGAWYTPDFVVYRFSEDADGIISAHFEVHEVKGHWREAARLRIKVAADRNPWFRFVAVRREGSRWIEENF